MVPCSNHIKQQQKKLSSKLQVSDSLLSLKRMKRHDGASFGQDGIVVVVLGRCAH
jgi:hypothetical protein